MNAIGHNKPRVGGVDSGQLKSVVERIERLNEEKSAVATDIREVFAEAKSNGFDVAAIRDILKLRKVDAQKREEREFTLDTYKRALQMSLPLEDEA